jgi:hypothetical protein
MNVVNEGGAGSAPRLPQLTWPLMQEGVNVAGTLGVVENVLAVNQTTPVLSADQANQLEQAMGLLKSTSPVDQLVGLKQALTVLHPGAGLAGPRFTATLSSIDSVLSEFNSVLTDNPIEDTLSLESSARVGALGDYIGGVKELSSKLNQLGVGVEGTPIGNLISQFDSGELTSFSQLSDAIAEFQSDTIKAVSPEIANLAGFDSLKLAVAGVVAKGNLDFDTNVALSLDDTLQAHSVLTELDLSNLTKENVAAAYAEVDLTFDKRAAELGISSNPKGWTPAERQKAQNDPMLSLLQIDLDWLSGLSANVSSGQELTRNQQRDLFTQLEAKYNTGMKVTLNYLTSLGETDSALYKDVEAKFQEGQAKLNEQKTLLNLVLQKLV